MRSSASAAIPSKVAMPPTAAGDARWSDLAGRREERRVGRLGPVGRLAGALGPHVHIGRLGPQRADTRLLACPMRERIEAEMPHRVLMRHLVDLVVGNALERLHQEL